jgi:hypothetical protein
MDKPKQIEATNRIGVRFAVIRRRNQSFGALRLDCMHTNGIEYRTPKQAFEAGLCLSRMCARCEADLDPDAEATQIIDEHQAAIESVLTA